MRKKTLFLILVLALVLTACGSAGEETPPEDSSAIEKVESTASQQSKEEESKEINKKNEDVIVKLEEVPFLVINIDDKPDSAGNVYVNFVYTNDSKYPITFYEIVAKLKDSNEKVNYICTDTVVPGEDSTNFQGFGPKSSKTDDIDCLEVNYTAVKDNVEYQITYDFKLQKYEQFKIEK